MASMTSFIVYYKERSTEKVAVQLSQRINLDLVMDRFILVLFKKRTNNESSLHFCKPSGSLRKSRYVFISQNLFLGKEVYTYLFIIIIFNIFTFQDNQMINRGRATLRHAWAGWTGVASHKIGLKQRQCCVSPSECRYRRPVNPTPF